MRRNGDYKINSCRVESYCDQRSCWVKKTLALIWTLNYFLFLMAFYKVLLKLASLAVTLLLLSAASSCHVSGTSKTLESQVIAT